VEFNVFKSGGFQSNGGVPSQGYAYDLWYDISTGNLFMSVKSGEQFLSPETDRVNCTNVFRTPAGLTIKKGLSVNLPTSAPVGMIFLCTDTLKAYAGTGVGLQRFNLDVGRALRGNPISSF
jgi:hypothetical protein